MPTFVEFFWLLLPKFNFWKGYWELGYASTKIWDFRKISLFPKILSLKSFGNSWGNWYTKFAILGITFHFTCGESDLYWNIVPSSKILWPRLQARNFSLIWQFWFFGRGFLKKGISSQTPKKWASPLNSAYLN